MTDSASPLKDHDLLVATYTLQQELSRQFGEYIRANDERVRNNDKAIQAASLNQARMDGEILSIKGMIDRLDERIDSQEKTSLWMNVGGYIGIIVAGVIAWFKT